MKLNYEKADNMEFKTTVDKIYTTELYIGSDEVGVIKYSTQTDEIFDFEVKVQYRGRNFGSALLDHAVCHYRPHYVAVSKDNNVAIGMYERRGFRIIDQFVNPADGKDCWYMFRETQEVMPGV